MIHAIAEFNDIQTIFMTIDFRGYVMFQIEERSLGALTLIFNFESARSLRNFDSARS